MALPAAKRAGDGLLSLKIVAAAALVPGQVMSAVGGLSGVVMGTINVAIGETAVLALDGFWEIDCGTATTASAGDDAYFNTSTGLVVTAPGSNVIWIGMFVKAKTSGQLKATVALNERAGATTPFIPAIAADAITAAGAISTSTYYTTANTTTGSGFAATLADGWQVGQMKKIQLIVDAGDLVLTPANFANGTTITFADVGDYALLVWNGSNWVAIETGNDADGVSGPAIA